MDVSTELMGKLLEVIPEALVVATPNRTIAQLNMRVCEIFGYEAGELIGQQTSILYENNQEYLKQGMSRFNAASAEHLDPYVVHYRRKCGEVFPGETIGTVLRNGTGEIIAFVGIIRDITEHIHRERELATYRKETKRQLREEVATIAQHKVNIEPRLFAAVR